MDDIVTVNVAIDGLSPSFNRINQTNRIRYLLTESEDERYWMAACYYATFYNEVSAIDYLVNVQNLNNDGWGPWHELGNQHQLFNITWSETVEVTVNICSLAVERYIEQESRLKRNGIWDKIQAYLATQNSEKDNNNDVLTPFECLCLNQQLWLYYGDAFFVNLHQRDREENQSISSKK